MAAPTRLGLIATDRGVEPESILDVDAVERESAAAAVALIVASARKGLVALCASVAQILKEKACLEKEVGQLRVQLHSRDMKNVHADRQQNSCSSGLENSLEMTRNRILCPCPLAGCKCTECSIQAALEIDRCGLQAQQFLLTDNRDEGRSILRLNDIVCLRGDLIGVVRYVGHLDGAGHRLAIFVGVELREPKGNTDGKVNSNSYFVCRMNYGVFVPLHEVLFVVGRVSATED